MHSTVLKFGGSVLTLDSPTKNVDLIRSNGLIVVKSAKQRYEPSTRVRELLEIFRRMVNDSIRIGLETHTVSLKRLSHFAYKHLETYRSHSVYRLTAISKAAGILASRKKSIRSGHPTKTPYSSKLVLVSCYGFKVRDGNLSPS